MHPTLQEIYFNNEATLHQLNHAVNNINNQLQPSSTNVEMKNDDNINYIIDFDLTLSDFDDTVDVLLFLIFLVR